MTFVPYPDLTAESANKRYRIEVRGNQSDKDFFRDQSGFSFSLVDATTDRQIWNWKPSENDGYADYPHEAWVSDDGWVVVRLHHWLCAGLLVLSPGGELRMSRTLKRLGGGEAGLLEDESDSHIGDTSAGPNWEASSIPVFHRHQGSTYWSIRTWWGRRLILDLERGTVLDDPDPGQGTLIDELEYDWVIGRLDRLEKLAQRDRHDRWAASKVDCYTAAFHAGALRVKEAEPFLRKLEDNASTFWSSSDSWIGYHALSIRQIAKTALLQLGAQPRWFANFVITNRISKSRCIYPECVETRTPELIREGMSQRELLQTIGVPEFIRNFWDYGFFRDGVHFTLRVHWFDKHKPSTDWRSIDWEAYRKAVDQEPPVVERIEKIEQPYWQTDSVRQYCIAHIS